MNTTGRNLLFHVERQIAVQFADSAFEDRIARVVGPPRDPREAFSTPRILEAWQIIAALRDGRPASELQ